MTVENLPEWLNFNETSKEISGTASELNNFDFTLKASNDAGTAEGVFYISTLKGILIPKESENKITSTGGNIKKETFTAFKNNNGLTVCSTDIIITVNSNDLSVSAGDFISANINLDLIFDFIYAGINEYFYSVNFSGLPEWLKVRGITSGTQEINKKSFHHVFTLTGTTSIIQEIISKLNVNVKISGSSVNDFESSSETDFYININENKNKNYIDSSGEFIINLDNASLEEIINNFDENALDKITKISIPQSIKNLKGIEKLKNLTYLNLTRAKNLISVDLEGNENITELNLTGAGVNEINIKGCKNLETLACSNNRLLWLDVNYNDFPKLKNFECEGQTRHVIELSKDINFNRFLWSLWRPGEEFSADIKTPYDVNKILGVFYTVKDSEEIFEADYNSSTGIAKLKSKPASLIYEYDTGFNGEIMDVTVYPASTSISEEELKNSGAGCNFFVNFWAFAVLFVISELPQLIEAGAS